MFALFNQTYPLTSIFVIDGPSTDGTEKALVEYNLIKEMPPPFNEIKVLHTKNIIVQCGKRIKFHYVRFYDDIGGSGGFFEGFKRPYDEGCNWTWVMDDDVLPTPSALEKLVSALKTGYEVARPTLMDNEDFSFKTSLQPLFEFGSEISSLFRCILRVWINVILILLRILSII